eukprot:jgi/Hompol1/2572/HPOL_006064-RA
MSNSELVQLLIQKHNSFLVKRNGITLSRETGNLRNVPGAKHSGLSADKPVAISAVQTPKGQAIAVTLARSKVPANKVSAHKLTVVVPGGVRRAAKSLKTLVGHSRPDLLHAALARTTRLLRKPKATKKN